MFLCFIIKNIRLWLLVCHLERVSAFSYQSYLIIALLSSLTIKICSGIMSSFSSYNSIDRSRVMCVKESLQGIIDYLKKNWFIWLNYRLEHFENKKEYFKMNKHLGKTIQELTKHILFRYWYGFIHIIFVVFLFFLCVVSFVRLINLSVNLQFPLFSKINWPQCCIRKSTLQW